MSSTTGQFANEAAADAPAAPVALARAWQARSLYGQAHPTVSQRLGEFCQATTSMTGPLRLYAEPGRMVCSGQPLDPRDLFAPLAAAFQRAGLAIMDIRSQVDLQQAQQLLALLTMAQAAANPAERDLPADIAQSTGGAVRVFTISAEHLRLRAISPGTAGNDNATRRPVALHELHQSNARPPTAGASATAAPGASDGTTDQAVDLVLEQCGGGDGRTPDAADLDAISVAVAGLSPDQRRQLLEALGCDSDVSFDDAARILALMPVRDVRDAIAVLERPDSRLSSTALMLLRRLAHLTLGNEVDLGRLARVAEEWATDEAVLGEDAGLARTTAELLKRLNDTEFRSQEYSDLLQQLSADQTSGRTMTCSLASDDLAQAPLRVIDVVCESLSCTIADFDASAPLRFLRERCSAIADLGEIDIVRRVLALSDEYRLPQRPDPARKAAQTVADAAATEQWVARAIAGITGEDRVRGAISDLRTTDNTRVDAYVAALSLTPSRDRYRALVACRDIFSAGELEPAIARCIKSNPHCAAALARFIHEVAPTNLIALLTPALLHTDAEVRRGAFDALGRLDVEWRDDLYVRGALDDDERVRMAAIRAIARRDSRHVRILIDRLAGRIGSTACTPGEAAALHEALAQSRDTGATTRMALTVCLLALWPMGRGDSRPLEAALRRRPRTALSRLALLLGRVSPVQIAQRLWKRKDGGDDHA